MKLKKFCAALLAGTLCLSILGGCASSEQSSLGQSCEPSTSGQTAADDTVTVPKTFKPSDTAIQSMEKYEYPLLGMSFTLPESLREQMDSREIAMLEDALVEDGATIDYAVFTWNKMTEDQLETEVESQGNGYDKWVDGLKRIGVLGVYHKDQVKNLDKLTKCSEHKEVGKSEDGVYAYYLSVNPDADKTLAEAVSQINVEITEMVPLEDEDSGSEGGGLGRFSMQDIQGETYTEEMFKDYELTMVNVFATWCTPCINEIPDLQKLYEEMAGQGVNVVGIVLDALDDSGNVDEEAVEKAKLLAERTKASYPFLIPDAGYLNGRLAEITAVPETFFVDKNGNIVGRTYSGSNSLEGWKEVVETERNALKGGDR